MMKRGPVRKIRGHACTTAHGLVLRCPKLPLHFTLRPAYCNAYAMVRQREKCVTGIVRKPFGGGGAFVVAEGHGTDGTSSVLGFDLLQISSSPTHARLPGREEPGEPVQALSQAHSRKGLRSRAFSAFGLVFGSVVCSRMR